MRGSQPALEWAYNVCVSSTVKVRVPPKVGCIAIKGGQRGKDGPNRVVHCCAVAGMLAHRCTLQALWNRYMATKQYSGLCCWVHNGHRTSWLLVANVARSRPEHQLAVRCKCDTQPS
eukprot:354555-Chlamydomonas_euryale.AAC.4